MVETKFNPYHDPRNGQFTFAPGGPKALGNVTTSWGKHKAGERMSSAPHAKPDRANTRRAGSKTPPHESPSATSLSRTHREFLSYSDKFPAKPGTRDVWVNSGGRGRAGNPDKNKQIFKDQYISGPSNVFKAAAKKYDIPVELAASVAHRELGNDNASNDVAYSLRAEGGRNIPESIGVTADGKKLIRDLNKPRAETSFGPYNIQQRRAAEILGYGDINTMPETARRQLVSTTRDPVAATFMLAKHLSDLRDQDFAGVAGKDLTRDQLLVIATRYKYGPEKSVKDVMSNTKAGKDYLMKWSYVKNLLSN